MYLSHYNLKSQPFSISPDSRFFWLSEKHSEALATLQYGIMANKGFLLVTGDVGTGKTALINRLIDELEVDVIVASIADPGLDILDFFKILAVEFNMGTEFNTKGEFLIQFKKFLLKAYAQKSQVLLIIDEAQRLNHELLEQIRLLSNIELNNRKLINIFFVGQNEFNDMIMKERNRAVRQRITLKYKIEPLTEKETGQYIKHRLKIAGATDDIFTADAIHAIFSITNGYPRLINIICDHALLSGYVLGIDSIHREVIKDCERDLNVSIPYSISAAEDEKPEGVYITPEDWLPFIEPEKPAVGKIIGLTFSLLMATIAIAFGGYFLYQFNSGEDNPWSVNEIISEKYAGILSPTTRDSTDNNEAANDKTISQPTTNDQLPEKITIIRIPQPVQQSIEKKMQKDERIEAKNAKGFDSDNNILNDLDQITQTQTNTPTLSIQKTKRDQTIQKLSEITTPANNVQEQAPSPLHNARSSKDNEIAGQSPGPLDPKSEQDKLIVYFNYDSNDLPSQEFDKLNYLVDIISGSSDSIIIIEGFTDSLGDYYYNKQLSKFRADVVKNYLVSRGVASERIVVLGKGKENPIASNDTLEGRRQNRRVEVRIE